MKRCPNGSRRSKKTRKCVRKSKMAKKTRAKAKGKAKAKKVSRKTLLSNIASVPKETVKVVKKVPGETVKVVKKLPGETVRVVKKLPGKTAKVVKAVPKVTEKGVMTGVKGLESLGTDAIKTLPKSKGGKKKSRKKSWIQHVNNVWKQGKKGNKNYSYGKAMSDARNTWNKQKAG